jgi:hypothetical protein
MRQASSAKPFERQRHALLKLHSVEEESSGQIKGTWLGIKQ